MLINNKDFPLLIQFAISIRTTNCWGSCRTL